MYSFLDTIMTSSTMGYMGYEKEEVLVVAFIVWTIAEDNDSIDNCLAPYPALTYHGMKCTGRYWKALEGSITRYPPSMV